MGATDQDFSQFVPGVYQELLSQLNLNFTQFIFIAKERASFF
jgi:hypothetical protein